MERKKEQLMARHFQFRAAARARQSSQQSCEQYKHAISNEVHGRPPNVGTAELTCRWDGRRNRMWIVPPVFSVSIFLAPVKIVSLQREIS
jgi:hypothetical protein